MEDSTRTEAERLAALENSEARFRALSEASPLGVFETDARGACTYANALWRTLVGLDETAPAERFRWSRVVHPEDRVAVTLAWRRSADEARGFEREFRILHDSGLVRHVRMLSRPVLADGVVTAHVGSIEDITERRAQEIALRKSEALLEATGELAEIGGWELDLGSGTLTWSERTCRIHGVEPGYRPRLDEAIDFYAEEARPVVRRLLSSGLADGRGWDFELPLVRSDGEHRWVRAVGRTELEGGKPVRVLGAFQDITERVRQRRALERAHERVMLATDSGRIGIWDWDVRRKTVDWTPQTYALFGLPDGPERLVDDAWKTRVHPEDRPSIDRQVAVALAGGESLDVEFRIVLDDGGIRHLHATARITQVENGVASRMLGAVRDVTTLRDLSHELAGQHERLRVTLQSIADAVVTVDAEARVTWLNPAAERLSGWASSEAVGTPMRDVCPIVDEATGQPRDDLITACLESGAEARSTAGNALLSRSGVTLGLEHSIAPIRSAQGRILGAVFVFRDVSERRRQAREMRYRATHDALTGLLNRGELEARLEGALWRARESGVEHALIYIDLDRFKLVNDTCGHAAGDRLLRQVSTLMSTAMSLGDALARVGGDEFAAVLENRSGDAAMRVAQDIRDRLNAFSFVHDGQRFHIGASVGLVPIDGRWEDVAAPMKAADHSCYAAKRAGRNRVHRWTDAERSLAEHGREARWVARLERALEEDRFVLHAQRIDGATGATDGLHAEVLIRMRGDDGRLIGPDTFLPAAERFHLATRVDLWVLRHVIDRVAALADLSALGTLSVNVSGQSVGDREFHREAIAALTAAGEGICRRLCLEITETAAITSMEDAAAFTGQVRALGVRVALDDFGAGASSFDYVRSLPADFLKIDGRYIRAMIDDPLDDAAVRCFVDVARVTGMRTVAECVDRPEVLARVRELGIQHVQGFLLHEPEPLENLLARLGPPVLTVIGTVA